MNILLAGDTGNTIYLLKFLKDDGHNVMLICSDYSICQNVANEYDIPVVCGDCTNQNILKEANTDKMDMVIAMCGKDADNLVVCELSKKIFHVKVTYSIINNPNDTEIFNMLGVDNYLNPSSFLRQMVDQTCMGNSITKYFNTKSKNYIIREIQISKKSDCANKKLWEIGLPEQCNIVSIFRGNEVILPKGNTQLLVGDKILIATSLQEIDKVIEALNVKIKECVIV